VDFFGPGCPHGFSELRFLLLALLSLQFSAWQVVQIYYKCKELGYVLPTVYQGNYVSTSDTAIVQ